MSQHSIFQRGGQIRTHSLVLYPRVVPTAQKNWRGMHTGREQLLELSFPQPLEEHLRAAPAGPLERPYFFLPPFQVLTLQPLHFIVYKF